MELRMRERWPKIMSKLPYTVDRDLLELAAVGKGTDVPEAPFWTQHSIASHAPISIR